MINIAFHALLGPDTRTVGRFIDIVWCDLIITKEYAADYSELKKNLGSLTPWLAKQTPMKMEMKFFSYVPFL